MTITAICLLRLPGLPLPDQGPVRAEALEDSVLLHTGLDFASDPADLAFAIRSLLGETLASQHDDPRGVYLIPSIATPNARTYATVLEEVGEGGVWTPWSVPPRAAPELPSMLRGMLEQMPESMFATAATTLRENPEALQQATSQLPELLAEPGALSDLLSQSSSQMPELANMLRAMGVDIAAPELAEITSGLQAELSRDPARLVALAQRMFGAADTDDESDA